MGRSPGLLDDVAFVAEAKKGPGQALANTARVQLDDYVPLRSRHAALLFYIEAADLPGVTERFMASLRERQDYDADDELAGSPFPVLRFMNPSTGRSTSIAIVFVHLNPRPAQAGGPAME